MVTFHSGLFLLSFSFPLFCCYTHHIQTSLESETKHATVNNNVCVRLLVSEKSLKAQMRLDDNGELENQKYQLDAAVAKVL